jgi:hypothetical protein
VGGAVGMDDDWACFWTSSAVIEIRLYLHKSMVHIARVHRIAFSIIISIVIFMSYAPNVGKQQDIALKKIHDLG